MSGWFFQLLRFLLSRESMFWNVLVCCQCSIGLDVSEKQKTLKIQSDYYGINFLYILLTVLNKAGRKPAYRL